MPNHATLTRALASWAPLLLLGGCGGSSFEVEALSEGGDTSAGPRSVGAHDLTDDAGSRPVDASRPRPPSDIPTTRLPPPPIVLPPQAVYDLPAAQTLTDRPYWRFVATQPSLSKSRFIPSDTDPAPTMELNVAGDWVFELRAWDEAEALSEIVWTQKISVIPGPGIHVELLWETPNDEDETDEGAKAGSDLDLHFVHTKYAVGSGYDGDGDGVDDPWFNQPFDTFWFTPHRNWGTIDPLANDDPSLDRDDTDGAGPENINLVVPQSGAVYGIGVHYWSSHEFGDAYATVRTYVEGVLLDERTQRMSDLDMWDVGKLEWPSAAFTPTLRPDGSHFVIPNYQNPNFSE